MKIGRVAATVVSTICSPFYEGRRLLLVDLLDLAGEPTGKYIIAVDAVDAGMGDPVLILDEGNSARQIFAAKDAPVRALVAGIIDELVVDDTRIV